MVAIRDTYGRETWIDRRRNGFPTEFPLNESKDLSEWEPYDFQHTYPDIRSALLAICMHGENLVGVELGVAYSHSTCAILQVCKNVSKLYGIDAWEPYTDRIGGKMIKDRKSVDWMREQALHFIHYSGESHRCEILEMNTLKAKEYFANGSLDFIFCDAHLSKQQLLDEMEAYYPKMKKGALFIGHDYNDLGVQEAVHEFRSKHNITNRLGVYDATFIWKV